MPGQSEFPDVDTLRDRIIGLGERSLRKSYYPELQQRIYELERANRELVEAMAERQRTLERMRATEDKFSTLFDAMTEMVAIHELVFDPEGVPIDYRLLQCNSAYFAVTGIAEKDSVGHLASKVYGSTPPPYLDVYARVAMSGEPHHFTDYYKPMDKYFSVSVVSPAKNLFATITIDVSAIERIKQALSEKNKELENYLYVASHDLRSPLVNIQGFSARLRRQTDEIVRQRTESGSLNAASVEPPSASEIGRSLDFIFTNVAKMDRLINGLLQISRTGRISMSVARISVGSLMRSVIEGLGFQIEQAGAEIRVGPLPDCYGDEGLLNQLFTNIVGNALKYRDGERRLIVTIDAEVGARRNVYCVRDTGIGIADRHKDRIWDVFYRVDWSGSVAGDGIGLSIVKRIVEKHNGRIWLESEEGKGSAFFVELPNEIFSGLE